MKKLFTFVCMTFYGSALCTLILALLAVLNKSAFSELGTLLFAPLHMSSITMTGLSLCLRIAAFTFFTPVTTLYVRMIRGTRNVAANITFTTISCMFLVVIPAGTLLISGSYGECMTFIMTFIVNAIIGGRGSRQVMPFEDAALLNKLSAAS